MLICPDALRSGKRNKLGTINEYRERVEVSSLSALNLRDLRISDFLTTCKYLLCLGLDVLLFNDLIAARKEVWKPKNLVTESSLKTKVWRN